MEHDKELEKYEKEAEKLKSAYLQCLGIISYLKKQKEKVEEKKEDK